jgi:prepilin-type N-terminal cleavage/methylation domain-containing protein
VFTDPSPRTSQTPQRRLARMPYRLRQHSQDESGFGLIELLVVILIIGVLAAIALPSLLAQKGKAYDAAAKELAHSAVITAETYSTDNGGEYKFKLPSELKAIERSLNTTNTNEAELTVAKEIEGGKGYELVARAANTGDEFTIKRNGKGETIRTCANTVSKTACVGDPSGTW